jgi:hypothetical protein
MEDNKERIKFLLTIDGAQQDEIISYSELIDIIEKQEQENLDDPERLWTFKEIVAHEGPLKSKDSTYKGSAWNVMVQWEMVQSPPNR